MAFFGALLDVTLQTLELLSPALVDRVALARDPYVLAFIGPRRIGRSRVIPAGATTFDLGPDLARFAHRLRVDHGQSARVEIQIWASDDASAPIVTLVDRIPPPWQSEERRVVGEVALTYAVDARPVPAPRASGVAPRAAAGTTTQATLRLVDTAIVDIVKVRGLHEPDPAHAVGMPAARQRDGYRGEDDKGRIYLNRDLTGAFHKDLQLIEVHARITMVRGHLPDGAKLRWRVTEPDDPTNDDPHMHSESGIYVDRLDYDGFTGQQLGARGFDNEGKPDRDPRWEALPRFALEIVSEVEARTAVVGDESWVRLHCPNVAGDNLIVEVELVADTEVESFGDATGILSMWNRVDVEYVRMKSAFELPVEDVALRFEAAFLQMDFTRPRVIGDLQFIGNTQRTALDRLHPFADMVFNHRGVPGWFCLIAALNSNPQGRPNLKLFEGPLDIRRSATPGKNFVDVPGLHPTGGQIDITWTTESQGSKQKHTLPFWSSPLIDKTTTSSPATEPFTRCFITSDKYFPLFVVGDGGPMIEFTPIDQSDGSVWKPGGYAIPAKGVNCSLWEQTGGNFVGMSLRKVVGNKSFSSGRTFVFTHGYVNRRTGTLSPSYRRDVTTAILHELTHALDLEHNCGYWDYQTQRTQACAMQTPGSWLLDTDDRILIPERLIPETQDTPGPELCGRHLKEARRAHLEDNPGLGWR